MAGRLKLRLAQIWYRLRRRARLPFYWLSAQPVFAVFHFIRRMDPDRASALGGRLARTFGPWLPVNRTGLENLRHAFPDRSEEDLRAILLETWENLGRTAAEYPHLDRLWDYDHDSLDAGRIEVVGAENFVKLRDDGRPAIVFAAHLANWELAGVGARAYGLDVAKVYRTPNNPYVARRILKIRSGIMGRLLPSGGGRPVAYAMAAELDRGGHLGFLVDQRLGRGGILVPFFGRPAPTNPTLGRLARRFDCPVHGVRAIRLPGNRFRIELTDEIPLPRDADGLIDVHGAMTEVNRIIEGWVREHPGQWLWLHRRWRRDRR